MKRFKLIIPVALSVLLVAAVAYASGGHEEAGGMANPAINFIARLINFAIFVFILWKFAGKKAIDFFGGRKKQIQTDLDDLEARKKEAQAKLEGVEKSIANIAQEKAAILEEARQQGEALKASIIAKANESAEKIRSQAKVSGEQEAQAAIESIRAEMADLVVEAAHKMLAEKLTKEDHEKLVDQYLTKVVLN